MTPSLPPLDGIGLLFLVTVGVFGIACLVAFVSILRRGATRPGKGSSQSPSAGTSIGEAGVVGNAGDAEPRAWWASADERSARPGFRAVVEELLWLAVPLLLLLWLWRAI